MQGLQSQIYDENLIPVSTCFSSSVSWNTPSYYGASGLTPGQIYWIMVDGFGGDNCDFTITAVSGVAFASLGQTPPITGSNRVCPGETATYSLNGNAIAPDYVWSVPSGATILSGQGTPEIVVRFDNPGFGLITCNGLNGCGNGIPAAPFSVDFSAVPPTIYPPQFFCRGDFPVTIDGFIFNSPRQQTFVLSNVDGCDSLVSYNIFAYTEALYVIDTTICFGQSIEVNGRTFNSSGSYSEVISGASSNGCDSTINLNLTVVGAPVSIPNPPVLDCLPGSTVALDGLGISLPPNSTVNWTASGGGNIVSGANTLTPIVDAAGDYILNIGLNLPTQSCTSTDTVVVRQRTGPAAPVLDSVQDFLCVLDTGFYTVQPMIDSDTTFWFFDNLDTLAFLNDTFVRYPWGTRGGRFLLKIQGKNECGFGDVTDTLLTIKPGVNPDLVPLQGDVICMDDPFVYSWNIGLFPVDSMIWDLDGGQFTMTGHNPPATNEIVWDSPGIKYISLYLKEDGCESLPFLDTIQVDAPLDNPILECTSTQNSIDFTWANVPNALSYDVAVLTGPSGTQAPNAYSVTGLSPNEEVTITLTVNGNTICGPTSDTLTCFAQNCPTITLDVQAVTTICLDAGTPNTNLQFNQTGGLGNGTATWAGPGTSPSGVFNPNTAGVGIHTVRLVYEEDNCTFNASQTIEVVARPTADFTADTVVCVNDIATLTYTGSAGPGATFNWNFGNSNVLSGSGAGPYTIEFNDPGSVDPSLEVVENGCNSSVFTQSIQVDPVLDAPTVSCINLTTQSVTFQWDPVPGANDYLVNVLFGATGTLSGNTYTVTGLMPGDGINIEVFAEGNSACSPSNASQHTCVANNCPPVAVDINPIQNICENQSGLINLTANINPQGTGSTTWSGPNVSANGILNLNGLNEGTYTVEVMYGEQGCSYVGTQTYTVLPAPEINETIEQPVFYTIGTTGSIQLDVQGNGPFDILWNDGSIISDRDSLGFGRYCATVTDANGCETEDCYDIGSGIFRISPVHIVCLGSSKVLTVRPPRGADFSWSPATGLSCTDCPNPIAAPRQSTEYTLTAVLDNGRTETIRILVIVIPPPFCPTAKQINGLELILEDQLKENQLEYDLEAIEKEVIKDQNLEADIVIYPNPTSGIITIQSEEVILKVEVSDILGKTVLQQSFDSKNPELDLQALSSGQYLLKVATLKGNSAFWIRKE
jgi:hypothetical protein